MQFSLIFSVIVAFVSSISRSSGLNILGIATTPSPSHHIWFSTLMNGLGRRGHNVYTLGIKPVEFDKDIILENRTESFVSCAMISLMEFLLTLKTCRSNSSRFTKFTQVFEGYLEKYQKEENFDMVSDLMRFNVFDSIHFFYTGLDNSCEIQMATDVAKAFLKLAKNTRIDVIVYDVTFGQCFYSLLEVDKTLVQ